MKLRTRIAAWIYMILFACFVTYALSFLIHIFIHPLNMGFGGLFCLFLLLVSTAFLTGWIGLVFKQKWAWWYLVVLHTLCSTFMLFSVWFDYVYGGPYAVSLAVMLLLLAADIVLIMDSPKCWQKNPAEVRKIQHRIW